MKLRLSLFSIKVLGTLTKIKKPEFDVDVLMKTAESYLRTMNERIIHRGKKDTAGHYKQLHLIAIAIVTTDKITQIPFCKSNKRGIPQVLKPVEYLLTGPAEYKRLGLTITRCYETIVGPAVWNPIPITAPGPTLSPDLIQRFTSFCEIWTKKEGIRSLKIQPTESLRGGLVQGPNGPSIITSHYDAAAVMSDQTLYTNLMQLASLTGASWIMTVMQRMAKTAPSQPFVVSKISLLTEGGYKTRVIGIGDYWSQNVLRPIHDKLMYILKKFKTDGTWDQNKQVERILRECQAQAHSFDLTSATDRFPVLLQEIVMSFVFSKEIASSWAKVLTQRPFRYKNEDVMWKVGQPLGLLSSWAAFSLTHHALIQFCAHSVGLNDFKSYAVLGDDVVIWNTKVATYYKELLGEIGVTINQSKSLIGDSTHNRVEFAKRILLDGVEVTGLKWDLLHMSARHLTMFPDLIRISNERHYDLPWTAFGVPAWRSLKRVGLLAALLLDTLGTLPPSFEGYEGIPKITISQLRDKVLELRVALIKEQQARIDEYLTAAKPLSEYFNSRGIYFAESKLKSRGWDVNNLHPIVWAINKRGEDLAIALSLTDIPPTEDKPYGGYQEIEYLPLPSIGSYFEDRKLLATKYHSTLVMKAWSELSTQNTTTTKVS
jgi:hypothetical protein